MWLRGDIVRRNSMLVTLRGERVKQISERQINEVSIDFKYDSYQILKLLWSSIDGSCSLVMMGNSWSEEQNTGTEGSTETYTGAFCFKYLP